MVLTINDYIKKEGPCFFKSCLLKMVVADPQKRISASQLLKEVEAFEKGEPIEEEKEENKDYSNWSSAQIAAHNKEFDIDILIVRSLFPLESFGSDWILIKETQKVIFKGE